MEISREILTQTEEYFKDRLNRFGATLAALDWNSKEAQRVRFDQLTKLLGGGQNDECFILCDYGCGYGDYFGYLQEKGYACRYTGIDLVKETIACADKKYGMHKNATFVQGTKLERTYDYIVANGIFNMKRSVTDEAWTAYLMGTLEEFCRYSKKGFAFNCLTGYSDAEHMREDLYYADPLSLFDYAKRHFSKNVALLHDYELYDFTIIVRKQENI